MEKFSQIKYVRPDSEKMLGIYAEKVELIRNAKSYDEMRAAFMQIEEISADLETMFSVASIRNTVDTADKFYEEEMDYFNEQMPKFMLSQKNLGEAYLVSPFRKDFEAEFGDVITKQLEALQKTQSEAIYNEQVEEANLGKRYAKLTATSNVEFRGETCNFYGLLKHMESTDREERKEAFQAWADLYESISAELDEIYSKMVELRVQMTKKLGFDNYADLAYMSLNRFDYDRNDVQKFRDYVQKYYVPVVEKIRKAQAKHLGIDKMHYYDEALMFPEGNPTPVGDKDYLVGKAQQMYHKLSEKSGEFFDFMVENDLFDLLSKPNKQMGGYCTFLPNYKAPFIFSNFNGTSADADVLTHEAGHAFQCYLASRKQPLSEFFWATYEVSEIHSMSMEHFAYPYIDGFFGDQSEKYRRAHLAGAIASIPYLVSVDAYQHDVYDNPNATPMERRGFWKAIEEKFLPSRDYDGNKFLSEGAFWMQKQHIFLNPFYYIDYALAQTCAFQFYLRSLDDFDKAWADYIKLCELGGSMRFTDLLKAVNLDSPFEEETIKNIASRIEKLLIEQDMIEE